MYVYMCMCMHMHMHIRIPSYDCMCLCFTSGVWNDGELPPGWREVEDLAEVYFWHVPSGTTQRERPVSNGSAKPEPDPMQEGTEAACLAPPPNNSQAEVQHHHYPRNESGTPASLSPTDTDTDSSH